MEYLSWDLAILSRATHYPNLSIASTHVGLSQPQLSRIVAKLEEQYGVQLLDREARRKSSWTPAALRLAEIYVQTAQRFRLEISTLSSSMAMRQLRVGTLEGLVPVAMVFCRAVLVKTSVMAVHLDVLDTGPLEERFAGNDLDMIFTARDMGAKKYPKLCVLGYQSLQRIGSGEELVYSMFEYASTSHKGLPTSKTFVSNSLHVRQAWLERFGGSGTLPSEVRRTKTGLNDEVTVMAVAHESMPDDLWRECKAFLKHPTPD